MLVLGHLFTELINFSDINKDRIKYYFQNSFLIFLHFLFIYCGGGRALVCRSYVWRSENKLWESFLSFHYVGSKH